MNRMPEHGRPSVTPIFAKKRQRQALLAHPNNTNVNSQSVGQAGPSSGPSHTGSQSWRSGWNQPQPGPSNPIPGPSNPTPGPYNPTSHWGAQPSMANQHPWGTTSQPLQAFHSSHHPAFNNTQDSYQGFPSSQQPYSQGPLSVGGNFDYGPRPILNNHHPPPGNSFNYGPTATPGPTYGQPAWGQPSLPPSNTQTPTPGPSHWGNRTYSGNTGPQLPAKFSQGLPNIPPAPYPGLQNNNQQNAGFRNTISQNNPGGASAKPNQSFKMEAKRSKPAPDNSLHFLAASIEGMLHWSQYRAKKIMMFELIAQLNSAVTSDHRMVSREFILRDNKKSIPAVFYEIDRQLPRLVRGQWYRCIGNMEPRSGRFRCVSIRSALEEERSQHQALIKAADKQMRALVAKLSET